MSEIKEQQSVMDLDTLGSNPKMMREANERWTDNDRRILIQIITKKNDGKYNKILSGKASTVTMMSQTWKNICDDFAAATNRDNVNLQKLRSLWKKIKQKEKSNHDKNLLKNKNECSKTGGGVGPNAPQVYDP